MILTCDEFNAYLAFIFLFNAVISCVLQFYKKVKKKSTLLETICVTLVIDLQKELVLIEFTGLQFTFS